MNRELAVSVVIPTVCRTSLRAAVDSALQQTRRPVEVIVAVDADGELNLPSSAAIRVVRTPGRVGPSMAKHIGVEASTGNIIALLDDDDVWLPDKLEKQLAAAPPGDEWIGSSRFTIHSDGGVTTVGPKTLITPDESVAAYLFEFRSKRATSMLPTPTLVFPRALAQKVPWSVAAGSIHDDPTWLIEVRRAFPHAPIIQVPEPLVDIMWTPASLSRSGVDRSKELIAWGTRALADESPRVRGDYMLTSALGSALGAGSFRGVTGAIVAGIRYGRPGLLAWGSAAKSVLKLGRKRMKAYR